jgi:hypothetical protein
MRRFRIGVIVVPTRIALPPGGRNDVGQHRDGALPLNSDLQSSLFYSLSTVAQTLSGAMGLLGAIVLFALQESTRSIERAATNLIDVPHASVSSLYLRHLLMRRSFHEIARRYGELLQPGGSTETSTEGLVHYATLTWELDHDNALRRAFWLALLASGVVISTSLICCAFTPQLSANPRVGRTMLIATVLGAVSCLVMYGILLRVMLRSTPHEPIPTTGDQGSS